METDVKAGRFLEHGEYDGNLYATKSASIHEVVEAGRICILDVSPQVSTNTHTHTQARTCAHSHMLHTSIVQTIACHLL